METRKAIKLFVSLVFISLFFLLPQKTNAGEPTVQIKETVDAVIKILNNKDLAKPEKLNERKARIREVVDKRFDFAEMAKRSLALHWKKRTPQEQKEFASLFSDMLVDTYVKKIKRYEDEKVIYTDERTEGSYSTVKTKIITTTETEIPVDYKIFKPGEKWEVYDIVVEGVSLVNNYRNQFSEILRSGTYEDLVKRIRDKTTK